MVRDRQHGPVVELNRIQVKRSRSKGGLAGQDGMKSVFGQMVSKIFLFNQEVLFLPHRVWKVKFVGKFSDFAFKQDTFFIFSINRIDFCLFWSHPAHAQHTF